MQIQLNNKVIISDPCYDLDVWCQTILDNVLPGAYDCFTKTVTDPRWGTRVTSLEVCHEQCRCPNYKPTSFTIGVDSGQAGIFDYDYYEKYHTNTLNNTIINDQWYDKVCDITLSPPQYGAVDNRGFVSSSGFGDGVYPCFIAKNNNGKIIAIRIDFIED